MEVYQRTIGGKVIVGGVNTKMGIGNGGTGHVDAVNNLLKEGRGAVVRLNVVNGERLDGGRKAKNTAYLTKGINRSHDERSNHMIIEGTIENRSKNDRKPIKERSETDQRTIGNRSKNNHRKNNQKPIKGMNTERAIRNRSENDHRKNDRKPIRNQSKQSHDQYITIRGKDKYLSN